MWNPFSWIFRLLRGRSRPSEPLEEDTHDDAAYVEAVYEHDSYATAEDTDMLAAAPPLDDDQAEVRPSIWVNIKLGDDGLVTDADHELRYEIENAIEDRGVGDWYGSGSGEGWMDVAFIVREGDTVRSAVAAVRSILRDLNVPEERVRIDVFND